MSPAEIQAAMQIEADESASHWFLALLQICEHENRQRWLQTTSHHTTPRSSCSGNWNLDMPATISKNWKSQLSLQFDNSHLIEYWCVNSLTISSSSWRSTVTSTNSYPRLRSCQKVLIMSSCFLNKSSYRQLWLTEVQSFFSGSWKIRLPQEGLWLACVARVVWSRAVDLRAYFERVTVSPAGTSSALFLELCLVHRWWLCFGVVWRCHEMIE